MWRIPHEGAPHKCTWMAWPWDSGIWNNIPGTSLEDAQDTIDRLIRIILKYENVCLLAPKSDERELEKRFNSLKADSFGVQVIAAEYNDIWVRDTLPTFAISNCGSLIAIDWNFNGWGKRVRAFAPYNKDSTLARKVARLAGAQIVDSGITAEGGAFAFDGNGLIVATKSVVFDKFRNKQRNKDYLEKKLLKASSCSSVCWLPGDRNEPITTGHADNILAFAENNTVLVHWINDESTVEYDVCDYNLRIFQEWANLNNRQYQIIKLRTVTHRYPDNYCASYVNFACVNGAIIVPQLAHGLNGSDKEIKNKIFEAFGGRRKIEWVDIDAIAVAGGGIHCITQHEPKR
jgi:agmatine deiminase